jgi:tetratricopeptide (TPR) repeat protein
MKNFFTTLLLLVIATYSIAQTPVIDSLKIELQKAKHDTVRAIQLYRLSYYYQNYKPDTALLLAEQSYDISKQSGFAKGLNASLGQKAAAYNKMGNSAKALETFLEQLKVLEKKNDAENIAAVYLDIAFVYSGKKDIPHALFYAYKADSIARMFPLSDLLLYTSLDIGDMYSKDNQLDSALLYTEKSYRASLQSHNDIITGTALNNLGNIFFKSGKYSDAIYYYKSSLPILQSVQDDNTLSECYLGLAQAYEKQDLNDSSLYFASRSYKLASGNQFIQHALHSSLFLSGLFKKIKNIDSAFAYQETYMQMKDSFDNSEKIRELQVMTFNEQTRQTELAVERRSRQKERKLKLELLLIGMMIPVFFFVSAYISRKKVHLKVIELSGIFSLIFLFEYITLLLHPVISEKASHSPVAEILLFVVIAAVLSPTHHKVEYWLISKLTGKHHRHKDPQPAI